MFCKVCIRLTHPPLIPFSPKSTVNFVLNRIQIYIVYIITMISVVADLSEYNKDTRIINFIEAHSMAYGSLHQQEMENTLEALDGIFQVDEYAWRAGKDFGHVEGLR